MSPSETHAIVKGYFTNRDYTTANFRPIYAAISNQYAKSPKTAQEYWPLSIDKKDEPKKEIDIDLYKKVLEEFYKN